MLEQSIEPFLVIKVVQRDPKIELGDISELLRAASIKPIKLTVGLKQALPAASIEETGERATMAYGAGTMQLVREHGLWKIENFD